MLTLKRHACKVIRMNSEAKLPKTQAATLAAIRELGQVEPGVQTPGVNLNAIGPLVRKGFARYISTEAGTRIQAV